MARTKIIISVDGTIRSYKYEGSLLLSMCALCNNNEILVRTSRILIPYRISCSCGEVLVGSRTRDFQPISCPRCKHSHLVFPTAVFIQKLRKDDVPVDLLHLPSQVPSRLYISKSIGRFVLAGLVCIAGLLAVLYWYSKPSNSSFRTTELTLRNWEQEKELAKQAMAEGAFLQAAEHWLTIRELEAKQLPVPAEELAWATYQERCCRMMADQLSESILEIFETGRGLSDRAWSEVFVSRYQGKSILFDCPVSRDGDQTLVLEYPILFVDTEVRLTLAAKPTWRPLPLPQRMLIGARVKNILRDKRGRWEVQLDTDQCFWVTEPLLLRSSSLPIDGELMDVIEKQRKWWQENSLK